MNYIIKHWMTIRTDCKNIVQISTDSTYSEVTFISPLVTYQYLFSNQANCELRWIDAFLKRAHKCGFSKELLTVNELLVESGRVMFKKMKSPTHCLHMLLPHNKKLDYNLRNSDTYVLPQCTSSTYKRSFVNFSIALFFIVNIVLSLCRLCTLSCTFFMHVWCVNSIKYEYE